MIAAIEGNVDVVKLLMEPRSDGTYGARLDICDKDDKSILFHAAEENQVHPLTSFYSRNYLTSKARKM